MKLVAGKDLHCPLNVKKETFTKLWQVHTEYAMLWPINLSLPDPGDLWHALSTSSLNAEKDAQNHIVTNFSKKAEDYIFFLIHTAICTSTIKMANKQIKKLATFVYDERAGASANWPLSIEKTDKLEIIINSVTNKIDLGPAPVTEEALFA